MCSFELKNKMKQEFSLNYSIHIHYSQTYIIWLNATKSNRNETKEKGFTLDHTNGGMEVIEETRNVNSKILINKIQ